MSGSDVASPTPIDGLVHADALEEAHRDIPDRPWARIALMALVLTVVMIAGWEALWRHEQFQAGDVKDTYASWAEQRRHAVGDATVLIGTSRNLYDVDLDVWQKTTGVRPVQLSLAGTSPRFMLADLANDPKFHGLVISDMVTGLFYGDFAGRGAKALPYYQHETPSQRAGFFLSIPPEYAFAYIDDQTRPKELWRRVILPTRPGQRPAFVDPYKIEIGKSDRNSEMWSRELNDPAYRERSIRIWGELFKPQPGAPPLDPPKVIAEVAANVAKIRARGGNVVFVFHPQGGFLAAGETHLPRAVFWDGMLAKTGTAGVRYQDYPQLQGFRTPELSHMHPRDAEVYTARLAPLVMAADAQTRPKPAG
ncbi:hypothetical protein BH10PSE4_BH10PSE4_25810 [soil metagenome]